MQFARNFEMDWTEAFTSLRDLPAETRSRLLAGCSIVELAEGTRIFGPGQAPDKFVMLLDGSIRVQQVGGNGREIVLYRVAAGETCALTTACLLGYEDYHAEAVAETDIRAALIRRGLFDQLIADSPEFRRFVFTTFSLRVTKSISIGRGGCFFARRRSACATSGEIGFSQLTRDASIAGQRTWQRPGSC